MLVAGLYFDGSYEQLHLSISLRDMVLRVRLIAGGIIGPILGWFLMNSRPHLSLTGVWKRRFNMN
jgi:hypothetical protein